MLKNIGGPEMAEYSEARQRNMIEPGIFPLTEALYATGAMPVSSCEGHNLSDKSGLLTKLLPVRSKPAVTIPPFAMFSASKNFAQKLNNQCVKTRDLFYCWVVKGHFHPDSQEMVWTLEPNDYRVTKMLANKQRLASDILKLSEITLRTSD